MKETTTSYRSQSKSTCRSSAALRSVASYSSSLTVCIRFRAAKEKAPRNKLKNYTLVSWTAEAVDEAIKYSRSTGLTGKAIRSGANVVSQLGKSDTEFNGEVDNVLGLKRIQNILVAPLSVPKSGGLRDIVGVLHLLNYQNGDIDSRCEVSFLLLFRASSNSSSKC